MKYEYKLVKGSADRLSGVVTTLLNDGWKLYGSPFSTGFRVHVSGDPAYPIHSNYSPQLAQALIRRKFGLWNAIIALKKYL